MGTDEQTQMDRLQEFTDAIDSILSSRHKKWVLVFDQINRLFAQKVNKEATDVGTLLFPFKAISTLMKREIYPSLSLQLTA